MGLEKHGVMTTDVNK